MDEGDACVFDQMTVHSASTNALEGYSRYVLFTTYFDISASYALLPLRGASLPPRKFPAAFRAALPRSLHYLLDWEVPTDRGNNVSGKWGTAENKLNKLGRLDRQHAHASSTQAKM
jgi:hypothetical protein